MPLVYKQSNNTGVECVNKGVEQFDAALKDSETTKRLVVRDCELLVLPPKVLERTIHLRELRLEHAKLKQLPASFGCLLLLERLSLSNNHLETLPLSFHKFQRLEELDLSCNKLRSLLGNFCNLGALRRLFMYDNALKKLPREFGALSSLEMLDVHNNRLWKLPKSFPCLAKLTRVDFSRNKLRKLPEAFGNLSALRICSLGRNVLSELPPFFGMLGSLEVLTLSYNALYKLPASFVDLISLTNLSLTGNRIESFPGPQFSGLKTLVTLTYSENRLRQWQPGEKIIVLEDDIPDNDQVIEEDVDGEVDELSNVFSNPLSPLENIQYLDLSDNALTVLPRQGWNRLTELVHLKLSRNRLQKLPSEIGKLPMLQSLDIAANKLEFLPLTLFSTKTLAFLNAHQNSLQTLPDNVGECEALVRLVLTKNRELHGLPSSFCCLSRLEELRVDKSCFLALDDAVSAFCRLALFSAD